MNFYDSDRMEDSLKPMGFTLSDKVSDSDLVILNTCHIREKAAEKVYSELGRIRKEKAKRRKEGKNMIIAVAGCVAQAEGKEIIKRAPFVDIVIGPQSITRLPQLIANATDGKKGMVDLDFSPEEKFDELPEESRPQGLSSLLTIQEGCDKFCTFCVVPYTRGVEFSRPVPELYREAARLVSHGAKELFLLGQNVNAYHGKGPDGEAWGLGQLIRHIAAINGLERIRYTTSHPRDMDDDLINAHGEVEKLMPFMHLPVQSGSDKILKEMNRNHTADFYRGIIDKVRTARPDIQFSSDFIVGFPGETDEDFKETMKLVSDIGYAQAYSFKYSARPGTPAANREYLVPEKIKDERLIELQNLISKQQEEFNKKCIGLTMPVLFDRKGKYEGQIIGRSPYMQSVHVMDGHELFGKIAEVTMTEAFANSLSAIVQTQDEKISAATGR